MKDTLPTGLAEGVGAGEGVGNGNGDGAGWTGMEIADGPSATTTGGDGSAADCGRVPDVPLPDASRRTGAAAENDGRVAVKGAEDATESGTGTGTGPGTGTGVGSTPAGEGA